MGFYSTNYVTLILEWNHMKSYSVGWNAVASNWIQLLQLLFNGTHLSMPSWHRSHCPSNKNAITGGWKLYAPKKIPNLPMKEKLNKAYHCVAYYMPNFVCIRFHPSGCHDSKLIPPVGGGGPNLPHVKVAWEDMSNFSFVFLFMQKQ